MELKEYTFRLIASLLLGSIIGIERHWHHKMAGLRTNILVSVGSTLFILLGLQISGDSSPSRIASQIVTGIGFLGAGVIMKEGLTIKGLNTAATLWCSASIGALCGIGSWKIAFAGTGFIILTHLIIRPLENYLNKFTFSNKSSYSKQEYILKIITQLDQEQRVQQALIDYLTSPKVKIQSISSVNDNIGQHVEIIAHITSIGNIEDKLQKISNLFNTEKGINRISWEAVNNSTEF